jgi:hypothetical protein
MFTFQKLKQISAGVTRRIARAESAGDQALVDHLLKQKLMLNRELRCHVNITNGTTTASQPGI